MNQQDFAAWLKQALEDAGVTQAEVARGLRISPSKVNRWIKGERDFKADDVFRLAAFLQQPLPPGWTPKTKKEGAGPPEPVVATVAARGIADEAAWRDNAMTAQNLARFPKRAALVHPLFKTEDQYYLPLFGGPSANDPAISAEFVICVPLNKLGRKVRPNDWVHVRIKKQKLFKEVVRQVVEEGETLILRALLPGPEDVPLSRPDVEIKGIVISHQQDRQI